MFGGRTYSACRNAGACEPRVEACLTRSCEGENDRGRAATAYGEDPSVPKEVRGVRLAMACWRSIGGTARVAASSMR